MHKGFMLTKPADFDSAVTLQINIEVWQQKKLIDYGGCIQLHTPNAVMINNTKYLKTACEFIIR